MEIILVTDKNNFFGQTRKPWVSIKTDAFVQYLKEFDINANITNFHKLINSEIPSGKTIFYHFSQKGNLRNFILDSVDILSKSGNRVIPSVDLLKCHENKGYQVLLKKSRNISDLNSFYFSSIDEIRNYNLKYPIVIKTIDGSNGKGVYLCHNSTDVKRKLDNFSKLSIFEKLDLFRRKFLRMKKNIPGYPEYSNIEDFQLYKDYITPQKRFIAQQYIPNQNYDFRVTVIYNRYFVMKRFNRKNDFRASGSKDFDFDFEIDIKLLNKSKSIKEKFPDSPYLSLDLIFDSNDNKYKLIEFQALHFGVSSIIKNSYYFQFEKEWEKIENKESLEMHFAWGLWKYLMENT